MISSLISALTAKYRARKDPIAYARSLGVTIGENCRFLGLAPTTFGSEPYLVRLGNHVTVTSGVKFVTHDGGVWVFRDEYPEIDVFGPIVIGDNVFIGINSIIMPGVHIGSNVVIGAGAIVTKDIPSSSVAVGSPARVIKDIDSYRAKVLTNALHIRSMPREEKKAILLENFRDYV